MTTRRSIACFDGTWNTPDSAGEPTNVVKLIRWPPLDTPLAAPRPAPAG